METSKILSANVLDIVFDGRNKSYGAYELRKNYEKRLVKSLVLTSVICIAVAGGAWLKSVFVKKTDTEIVKIMPDVTIADIKDVKKELPPLTPPPMRKIDMPKVQSVKLTTPIVTKDVIVDPPPTQDELKDSRIDNITQMGVKDAGVIIPPESVDDRKGLIAGKTVPEEDYSKTFIVVEIDARYPSNWKNFLEKNLSGEVPVDNGAPPGTYTVTVQFIVDAAGNVSDVQALTHIGYGMEAEAIRVIKRSGKWKPAIQNGREVKAYRRQPVTFQVMEQ
ncbi:MAG: energy transducer TonB [Niabella sp.]